MSSIRLLKTALFSASEGLRVARTLRRSSWRANRLLILSFHGISQQDEHEWNPALYMSQEVLRRRLGAIREHGCHVLPFGEALSRLYRGALPPASVALTFDDGAACFYSRAYPVLREFGYPATVYWTTYYSASGLPVPDVAAGYLLWRARGQHLHWPGMFARPVRLDAPGRAAVETAIRRSIAGSDLKASHKDNLIAELAQRLGIDYAAFRHSRLLQIMSRQEASELARAGVDLQLHTHRHRTATDRFQFLKEIDDNRRVIQDAGAPYPTHFCYPSGNYQGVSRDWLAAAHLTSAVTCDPGLASPQGHPYELPRLVDSCHAASLHFRAWLSGLPHLLPRRGYAGAPAPALPPARTTPEAGACANPSASETPFPSRSACFR